VARLQYLLAAVRSARGTLVGGSVLLTGASGGIGHAIAHAFAVRGARLVLTGRRIDELEQLAASVGGRSIACDLAVSEQLEQLVAAAGEVDVLVANAALPATGHLNSFSAAQLDTMLDVNLRAPIALARALSPGMVDRHRGHLVFVSSLAGRVASPRSSMYSATKFGLRGFALGLRQDLRRDGVGVSVVSPGFIRDAGMFADADVKLPPGVGTSTTEQVAAAVIRAVEHNRAEVTVAPLAMRIGTDIASVAPGVSAAFQRFLGADRTANKLADSQLDKRPPA
jgi:short-subunit dehydrogenase